jgi:hypothetical protein
MKFRSDTRGLMIMTCPQCAILAVVDPARSVTEGSDPHLRFRVFTGGRLAVEHWFDARTVKPGDVVAMARDHAHHCREADEAGLPWLVEIYDPARPPDRAYIRWGTDHAGMCKPGPVTREQLAAELRDRLGGPEGTGGGK